MSNLEAAYKEIQAAGIEVKASEPMKLHTTYKIGGPADLFYSVDNLENLLKVLEIAKKHEIKTTISGCGSNILVADDGIRGLVISFNKAFSDFGFFNELEASNQEGLLKTKAKISKTADFNEDGSIYLYAEAGGEIKTVSRYVSKQGVTGMEYFTGIPGSIGGAVYMNAGAYGGMTEDVCIETYYIDQDLNFRVAKGEEQEFSYRESLFHKEDGIILASIYKLKKGDPEKIDSMVDDFTKRRSALQPLDLPSCGSVFKRPDGYYAGKLIMDSGLQGFRVGDAMVSTKHAGFIVNVGEASAKDVLAVIRHVQAVVYDKYEVELEPEVRIIGDW